MEFQHLLPFLIFLSLAVVVSHAALSPEAYWNSQLPNTPLPKTVKDLLYPELMKEKSSSDLLPQTTAINHVDYKFAATNDHLHDNPKVALFFLEKNMNPGTKMTLHFTKTTAATTFLPREASEKIPFSSNKFPEILNYFSLNPQSLKAQMMKKTIKECEEPEIKGEEKYCATSLESMVDFITSKLGKNVNVISIKVQGETQTQEYGIVAAKKMGCGESVAVCHKQNYAYAVFYCHKTQTTRAYLASLVGHDGTKANAVAVCHTDTSAWNPKHLAFQVLKVKPGTVPVCHFLPDDHLVWVLY